MNAVYKPVKRWLRAILFRVQASQPPSFQLSSAPLTWHVATAFGFTEGEERAASIYELDL